MIKLKHSGDYTTFNIDFQFILKETENDIFGPYDLPIGKPRPGLPHGVLGNPGRRHFFVLIITKLLLG